MKHLDRRQIKHRSIAMPMQLDLLKATLDSKHAHVEKAIQPNTTLF